MYYLGIDIGGTAVKMGIVTSSGEIISKNSYDVAFDGYETPIFLTVKSSIEKFLIYSKVDRDSIKGIGVSATGQIDTNNGSVVGVGGNIKNWCNTNIKTELESLYGVKTTVVNDANCMVIGEQWKGPAKGYKNIIGITIGTGIGGGIIVNSNILLGTIGIASELGHFSIKSDGIPCTCGNVGCYERYASMTALIRTVSEKYEDLGEVSFTKDRINGKSIFDEIEKGNVKLKSLVDQWLENIAKGLVSLIHIFNPEIILIGGGVSKQEQLFINPIREYVLKNAMEKFTSNLKIEAASLGNDAGLVGAVYYLLNN